MTRAVKANAPNFFILGGAKCGTTTLYHLLRQHPQIFLIAAKEAHFFTADRYYRQGLDAYLRHHFRGAEARPLRGEATPNYLHAPELVAPRMREMLGESLRFIVLLRDPVQRAWSHYLHMLREGAEKRGFAEALDADLGDDIDRPWTRYYSDGLYAQHLRKWHEVYPPESFLILFTHDLRSDLPGITRRSFVFLGVDPEVEVDTEVDRNPASRPRVKALGSLLNRPHPIMQALKHAVPYVARQRARKALNRWNRLPLEHAPSLEPAFERLLRDRYAVDVRDLEEMVGCDLSAWLPAGHVAE